MSRLSIRARITLGSLIVATVLVVAALWLVHEQVGHTLVDANVTLATTDLASFEADIVANPTEPVDPPAYGVLVLVRSPDQHVEVDTMPRGIHEALEHRDPGTGSFTLEVDEAHFVVVASTVQTPEGTWALWAARSTDSTTIAVAGLDRILVIGGIVLLVGFGAASWWLASAALRPVARLRRGAERLAADPSAAELLPVGGANDELTELAQTLNTFLTGVRASVDREKQMISDAAHELRTPIAVLKTQLELARDDVGENAALATQLDSAEHSVDRLGSLASNLLELSRLEQAPDAVVTTSTREIVVEFLAAIDRARLMALPRGIDVGFSSEEGTETLVPVSVASFGRVCDNLIANALAAATSTVHVSLTVAAGIDLKVHDDGAGMPEEFLPHAFERFSRSDKARSTGGSGLGLSLVAAIASSAGGSVSLHNTTPGFTVEVVIPKM